MVRLTEVEDEHFAQTPQTGKDDPLVVENNEDNDDEYSDTDSEISSDSYLEDLEEETLSERILALQDMIPPQYRRRASSAVSSVKSLASSTLSFSGKALWVVSTSAFFIGIPWALAFADEQQIVQMEREQGMIKGANETMTPGATSALTSPAPQQSEGANPSL